VQIHQNLNDLHHFPLPLPLVHWRIKIKIFLFLSVHFSSSCLLLVHWSWSCLLLVHWSWSCLLLVHWSWSCLLLVHWSWFTGLGSLVLVLFKCTYWFTLLEIDSLLFHLIDQDSSEFMNEYDVGVIRSLKLIRLWWEYKTLLHLFSMVWSLVV
jgi:hypothetical protein